MDRLIYGNNKKIYDTILPHVEGLGFDVVRISYTPNPKNPRSRENLQIMIERKDKSPVIVEDCETVSRNLSLLLEVEDVISQSYNLEISSTGIDKPLTRISDFIENIGKLTKLTFIAPVDNHRNLKAVIIEADMDKIVIKCQDSGEEVKAEYDNIAKAKLVLTDELLSEAQNLMLNQPK